MPQRPVALWPIGQRLLKPADVLDAVVRCTVDLLHVDVDPAQVSEVVDPAGEGHGGVGEADLEVEVELYRLMEEA